MPFETGYIQHGHAGAPMRTEAVSVKHEYADRYLAFYEGKWRRVHIQMKRLYIVYQGENSPFRLTESKAKRQGR